VLTTKLQIFSKVQTNTRLVVSFWDNLGEPAPERLNQSRF